MQREAGLYGMIRVSPRDPEPFAYDYDRSIILNDWYHKSTYEQATGLSSIPFEWVGEPQVNDSAPLTTKNLFTHHLHFFILLQMSRDDLFFEMSSTVTSDPWKRKIQLL